MMDYDAEHEDVGLRQTAMTPVNRHSSEDGRDTYTT
jgi:hypothetical protein